MPALIIETSTERGCVALIKEGYAAKIELPIGLQNSQYLLPEIQQLLFKEGLSPSDLTHLVVGIGPGSYTGIRVGVVVAKTLAYALKIPLVGICTLQAFVPDQEGSFAVLIDAKIGGAYMIKGERIGQHLIWHTQPVVAELPQVVADLAETPLILTPMIQPLRTKMEKVAQGTPWKWLETPPNPAYMFKLAQQKMENGEYSSDGSFELLYLRKTQAELERSNFLAL